jgi:hypothetical protein
LHLFYPYGMVSHNASQALRPFSDILCVPLLSSNNSLFIHQSSLSVNNPWRYSSDEPRPAEQPPLAVFPDCTRRYWVDMWSAHRIPQLHFSAFQTGPLLLYSSNYSVYPITRLSGPRSRPNSLRKILRSVRKSNPIPLCFQSSMLTTRP